MTTQFIHPPFPQRIRALGTKVREWRWPWWLALTLLALPTFRTFTVEGLPRSFDGGLHLLRLSLLDSHIRQGMLLPRWTPSLMLGYGYPLYNFYGPGGYYVAEILHLLGMSLYYAFISAFCLLILAAGYGMFLLADDIFGLDGRGRRQRWAAFVAATAYMYGPYLLVNVYQRGALAETMAQALLPWIFLGIRRLCYARQPDRYLLLTSFTLGGLAITHNITLLFLPPILLVYLFWHWRQTGFQLVRLLWLAGSLLLAMGLSAFYWLPLLGERRDLADTAYEIARQVWLPSSVWRWHNFLDTNFFYQHTFFRPVRLGIVQICLAVVGFVLARRRDGEWIFWLGVAMISGALMGAWALPIWMSNDILPVAQFTWRLLSILSFPLALFVGGAALWHNRWAQAFSGIALVALVVVAQVPRLGWMDVFAAEGAMLSAPVFAQVEIDKGVVTGGEGNSSLQEFRPRWADESLVLLPETVTPAADMQISIQQANDFDLLATVNSASASPLRFTTFYFPGWQITVDDQPVEAYPSTNLGLLTVDLPVGTHAVQVRWVGTDLQHWASRISIATLGLLLIVCAWRPRLRRAIWMPLLLLALAVGTILWPRPMTNTIQPTQPFTTAELTLTGYRFAQPEAGYLYLYPYWYVHQSPSPAFRLHWQLLNAQGAVISEISAQPYFNTASAENWPPGTLVDDAYRLPLPSDMAAGTYQVRARMETALDAPGEWYALGAVDLAQATKRAEPTYPLELHFEHGIELIGYDLSADRLPVTVPEAKPLAVQAGQYLRYTLYWQAAMPPSENYHGFIHLTDLLGKPLVQEDQMPGPLLHPPLLWDNYRPQSDTYLLRIPPQAPSGLYWPKVGLYEFETLNRLTLVDGAGDAQLPPIKIIGAATATPQQSLTAQLGDFAQFLGYTLQTPTSAINAGTTLDLTLYYRSTGQTDRNYTRFVQLYSPELGMADQQDGPPQAGNNPTWAWLPDEEITDPVTLQIAADAQPGAYDLYIGFYDAADGVRVSVHDQTGAAVPEAWLKLTTIQVSAE